jgi:hypothetical protein
LLPNRYEVVAQLLRYRWRIAAYLLRNRCGPLCSEGHTTQPAVDLLVVV